MNMHADEFMALLKDGNIAEARAMIEAEKVKAQYAPDTINVVKGKPPRFTKKSKSVEVGEDGVWRLKVVSRESRKR
jgi:hypothetical protein